MVAKTTERARRARTAKREASHPQSVPIISAEEDMDAPAEQPFAEGVQDAIDPDLRHRMISEAAYHRYAERGYADGYDLDDWFQAEAEVDHLLLVPPAGLRQT